jgi:hypothetical protein
MTLPFRKATTGQPVTRYDVPVEPDPHGFFGMLTQV